MKVRYDKKKDCVYLRFSEAKYFESDDTGRGIILDFDRQGKLIGLEVLDTKKNLPNVAGVLNKFEFEVLPPRVAQA